MSMNAAIEKMESERARIEQRRQALRNELETIGEKLSWLDTALGGLHAAREEVNRALAGRAVAPAPVSGPAPVAPAPVAPEPEPAPAAAAPGQPGDALVGYMTVSSEPAPAAAAPGQPGPRRRRGPRAKVSARDALYRTLHEDFGQQGVKSAELREAAEKKFEREIASHSTSTALWSLGKEGLVRREGYLWYAAGPAPQAEAAPAAPAAPAPASTEAEAPPAPRRRGPRAKVSARDALHRTLQEDFGQQGVKSAELRRAAEKKFGREIASHSASTALWTLGKEGLVRRDGFLWYAADNATAEEAPAAAPPQAAQAPLATAPTMVAPPPEAEAAEAPRQRRPRAKISAKDALYQTIQSYGQEGVKSAELRRAAEKRFGREIASHSASTALWTLGKEGMIRREGFLWYATDANAEPAPPEPAASPEPANADETETGGAANGGGEDAPAA